MRKFLSAGYAVLLLLLILPGCSTVKNIPGINIGNISQFDDVLKKPAPVSTSFEDASTQAVLADDFGNDKRPQDLAILPRTAEGAIMLRPGFYEYTCKSFCLRAGTHGPSQGDGYLYAPLKGNRADIVHSILRNWSRKPSVQQRDVQFLLWAIIARTDFKNLPSDIKAVAAQLLTPKEIFELNGGVLGIVPEKVVQKWKQDLSRPLQQVLEAENKIRTAIARGTASYQALEEIAILPGSAEVDRPEFKKGRWSLHPDGYYVRFFPNGYQQTRVQVYLPAGAGTANRGGSQASLSLRTTDFPLIDLASIVALPANTGSQRLGLTPPPIGDTVDNDYVRRKLPACFKHAMATFGIDENTVVNYFRAYNNGRAGGRFFHDIDELIDHNPYGMDECDVYAIWGYTTNLFYRDLNRWLRERRNGGQTGEISRLINEALAKLPTYPERYIYRGLRIPDAQLESFARSYGLGNRNVWDGFISCGGSIDASFGERSNVVFEIEHISGKDISEFADGIRYGVMPPPEVMIREGRTFESISHPVWDDIHQWWFIRVRQLN